MLKTEIERHPSPPGEARGTEKPRVAAIVFDVEVAVAGSGPVRSVEATDREDDEDGAGAEERGDERPEEGTLELHVVLRQRSRRVAGTNGPGGASALMGATGSAGVAAGLLGLDLGVGGGGGSLPPPFAPPPLSASAEERHGVLVLRSPPVRALAVLVPPLFLERSPEPGPRAAQHWSRWSWSTRIAFHPGQSRLLKGGEGSGVGYGEEGDKGGVDDAVPRGRSMRGGELSVLDMSRRVRWGFAPGSAPDLPLVLGPYEAFATVIQIDAGEDVRSRAFLSPV